MKKSIVVAALAIAAGVTIGSIEAQTPGRGAPAAPPSASKRGNRQMRTGRGSTGNLSAFWVDLDDACNFMTQRLDYRRTVIRWTTTRQPPARFSFIGPRWSSSMRTR